MTRLELHDFMSELWNDASEWTAENWYAALETMRAVVREILTHSKNKVLIEAATIEVESNVRGAILQIYDHAPELREMLCAAVALMITTLSRPE